MAFILCHVWNSGEPIAINTDAITQVCIIRETTAAHTSVHRMDGGSVELRETWEQLVGELGVTT